MAERNPLQKIKEMKKEQWLIVILFGVLLFVVALPSGGTKKSNNGQKKTEEKEMQESVESEETQEYEAYLEERIEEILGQMEGVGRIQAMVTLEDGGEQILDKNEKEKRTETGEGSGENERTATEVEVEYGTIFVEEDGNRTPYIVQIKKPKVKGVVVVCKGGGNSQVAQNISKAVSALFSIETHKIMVMKME